MRFVCFVAFMGFVALMGFMGLMPLMGFMRFVPLVRFPALVSVLPVGKGGLGRSEEHHPAQECRNDDPLEHRSSFPHP